MKFGLYLIRQGAITAEQFVAVLQKQQEELVPLGQLAIEEGKLSVKDVFRVLRIQTDVPHDRFGKTALELGLMKLQDLAELLMVQTGRCRSFADLVVEMGFVSRERTDRELLAYRRGLERDGAAAGFRRVVSQQIPLAIPERTPASSRYSNTNGHRNSPAF